MKPTIIATLDGHCSIDGCGKKRYGRGWCLGHYRRWKHHGDPLSGRTPDGELERFLVEVVLPYDGDECLIWPYSKNSHGYAVFKRKGKMQRVARVVCEEEHGPPPTPSHQAAHSCGKGHLACVTKRHLSWKTRAENEADKLVHGTHRRGERNHLAKLAESEVREIRALKGTLSQAAIAKKFGIASGTVGVIHRRERWAWLDGEAA